MVSFAGSWPGRGGTGKPPAIGSNGIALRGAGVSATGVCGAGRTTRRTSQNNRRVTTSPTAADTNARGTVSLAEPNAARISATIITQVKDTGMRTFQPRFMNWS